MSSDQDPEGKLSVFLGTSSRTGSASDDNARLWKFSFEEDCTEELLATQVGPSTWLLAETPALSSLAKWHDIIEGTPDADGMIRFKRVAQPSGFVTFENILSLKQLQSPSTRALKDDVIAAGGWWENLLGGVFVVHVPPTATHLLDECNTMIPAGSRQTPDVWLQSGKHSLPPVRGTAQ